MNTFVLLLLLAKLDVNIVGSLFHNYGFDGFSKVDPLVECQRELREEQLVSNRMERESPLVDRLLLSMEVIETAEWLTFLGAKNYTNATWCFVDEETVKMLLRVCAMKWHPDKTGRDTSAEMTNCSKAAEYFKDPQKVPSLREPEYLYRTIHCSKSCYEDLGINQSDVTRFGYGKVLSSDECNQRYSTLIDKYYDEMIDHSHLLDKEAERRDRYCHEHFEIGCVTIAADGFWDCLGTLEYFAPFTIAAETLWEEWDWIWHDFGRMSAVSLLSLALGYVLGAMKLGGALWTPATVVREVQTDPPKSELETVVEMMAHKEPDRVLTRQRRSKRRSRSRR